MADKRVAELLAALEAAASPEVRAAMAPRYGIVTDRAMGVPMAAMQRIARGIGRDHALAAALWETGWYEARSLACLIDDPAAVDPEQMDRWRADFDNWAIVDTACFKLFDRTAYVFSRIDAWAQLADEFGRRAAFALMASAALHGRGTDADFLARLHLVEAAATDPRNFVWKGVAWALRATGTRRGEELRAATRALALRLAEGRDPTERRIGREAQRAFAKQGS